MSWIPADGSDLEKVKAAHDWICTHVTYYDGPYNQVASNTGELEPVAYGVMQDYYDVFYAHCAYGAFAKRSCVCQGFAHAFKLLMDNLGVDCRVVSSLWHDWNAVKIDDSWFVLDTTWNAGRTDKVDANDNWDSFRNQIAYTYFMVSDAEMIRRDREYSNYGNESEYHVKVYQVESNDIKYDGYVIGQNSPWYEQSPSTLGVQPQNVVTSFELSDITLALSPGDMQKISIGSIDPANANPQMSTWTTSDPNVALVLGDGTVLAVAQGGATITWTVRDVHRECVVAVGEDTRPKPIAGALVADIEDQEYTGSEIEPEPAVTLGDATLTKDVDYVLTYTNNVEEGTATRFRSSMASPLAVLLAKLIAIRTNWNCSSEQLPLRW